MKIKNTLKRWLKQADSWITYYTEIDDTVFKVITRTIFCLLVVVPILLVIVYDILHFTQCTLRVFGV